MVKKNVDYVFLLIAVILVGFGLLIFWSASWGLLARDEVKYGSVALRQIYAGLIPGLIALFVLSNVKHERYKTHAFFILLFAVVVNLLVFVPSLGITVKGATRWLDLGFFSFQPSELLKLASIIYFAAWLAKAKDHVQKFSHGIAPFALIVAIVGAILLAQPDTDTLVVIAVALVAMLFYAGAKWKHLFLILMIGILGFGAVAYTRPYVMSRIVTFFNPASDLHDSGWQLSQSLMAIGSGGMFGRGFGQSIQKFDYLPEPVGDSIFAVAGEEFGFIGASAIVLLYVFFALKSFNIASNVPHLFSKLLVIGLAVSILIQSFINIGSMVGLLPLSGIPLVFISHGGTALLFALASVGIILNVSRAREG